MTMLEMISLVYVCCVFVLFALILRYELDLSLAELLVALMFSPFILSAAVAGAIYFVARRLKLVLKSTEALVDADLRRRFGDK